MDHYGTVAMLGDAAAQPQMAAFTALLGETTVPQVLGEPPARSQDVMTGYHALFGRYHQIGFYAGDANALASASGIDPTRPRHPGSPSGRSGEMVTGCANGLAHTSWLRMEWNRACFLDA